VFRKIQVIGWAESLALAPALASTPELTEQSESVTATRQGNNHGGTRN
jgi:hypothetical protein